MVGLAKIWRHVFGPGKIHENSEVGQRVRNGGATKNGFLVVSMNCNSGKYSGAFGFFGLVAWLLACFCAATMGALFMPGEWYAALKKPSWTPPDWLFGPVWTLLYATMAVSAWLVWKRGGFAAQRRPLTLFILQLVLNAAWTPLFFGLKNPGLAFVEIVMLWLAIAAMLATFRRASRAAAWLLVPYLLWVSFAAALNFAVWRLNT